MRRAARSSSHFLPPPLDASTPGEKICTSCAQLVTFFSSSHRRVEFSFSQGVDASMGGVKKCVGSTQVRHIFSDVTRVNEGKCLSVSQADAGRQNWNHRMRRFLPTVVRGVKHR